MSGKQPSEIQVWDPLVRIGHWLLVAAFFVAYFTEEEMLAVHSWAGYVVAAYIAVRVVWGFVGSRHARFSNFLFSPFRALSYLIDMVRQRALRYVGHSPAGAMMVFALLVSLTGTAVTGMAELASSRGEGPLAPLIDRQAATQNSAEDERGEEVEAGEADEGAFEELHEFFANLTLALVAFHLLGVAAASWSHRENLVRAMITGRKRANGGAPL